MILVILGDSLRDWMYMDLFTTLLDAEKHIKAAMRNNWPRERFHVFDLSSVGQMYVSTEGDLS